MILAGELQFYQLEKSWLKKIQPWMGFEPMPPRYSLGAATNWARKPYVGSEENLRGFISFVEKTYALWNEINQIEPWWTQVSWKKDRKKKLVTWPARICLAQIVRGLEKSGNKFVCFSFSYFERCFIDTLSVLKIFWGH